MAVVTSKKEIYKIIKKFVGKGKSSIVKTDAENAPSEIDLYQPSAGMTVETMMKIDKNGVAYVAMDINNGEFDIDAITLIGSLKFYRYKKNSLRALYEGRLVITSDKGDEFKLLEVIMTSKKAKDDCKLVQTEILTWQKTNGEGDKEIVKTIWSWRIYIDGR